MWALLALYQALRIAVTDAVTTVPGTDPDRASYQIAVQTAQILVTGARNVATGMTDLAGDIGRAVLANLHGPRRPRVCARKVKSPLSRWNKRQPGKPRTCQQVTSLTVVISQYRDQKRTRRRQSLTPIQDLKSPALRLGPVQPHRGHHAPAPGPRRAARPGHQPEGTAWHGSEVLGAIGGGALAAGTARLDDTSPRG